MSSIDEIYGTKGVIEESHTMSIKKANVSQRVGATAGDVSILYSIHITSVSSNTSFKFFK